MRICGRCRLAPPCFLLRCMRRFEQICACFVETDLSLFLGVCRDMNMPCKAWVQQGFFFYSKFLAIWRHFVCFLESWRRLFLCFSRGSERHVVCIYFLLLHVTVLVQLVWWCSFERPTLGSCRIMQLLECGVVFSPSGCCRVLLIASSAV